MQETKQNLLRAFAGECQARMRYEMAGQIAAKQQLPVIEKVFKFTANQEKEHAQIFYDLLKNIFKEENIDIDAGYPVDIHEDLAYLLQQAALHEEEEAISIYKSFGETAKKEGYPEVASAFFMISDIEHYHHNRFKKYHQYLTGGMLFADNSSIKWMCLNCGFIYEGNTPLQVCPVCKKEQGYFIRLDESPFNL